MPGATAADRQAAGRSGPDCDRRIPREESRNDPVQREDARCSAAAGEEVASHRAVSLPFGPDHDGAPKVARPAVGADSGMPISRNDPIRGCARR